MHITDLDREQYPYTGLVQYNSTDYFIAFKDFTAIHLFKYQGEAIEPMGAIDGRSVTSIQDSLENTVVVSAMCIIRHPKNTVAPTLDTLQAQIAQALATAQQLNQGDTRSRNLSLAITQLENAEDKVLRAIAELGRAEAPVI